MLKWCQKLVCHLVHTSVPKSLFLSLSLPLSLDVKGVCKPQCQHGPYQVHWFWYGPHSSGSVGISEVSMVSVLWHHLPTSVGVEYKSPQYEILCFQLVLQRLISIGYPPVSQHYTLCLWCGDIANEFFSRKLPRWHMTLPSHWGMWWLCVGVSQSSGRPIPVGGFSLTRSMEICWRWALTDLHS